MLAGGFFREAVQRGDDIAAIFPIGFNKADVVYDHHEAVAVGDGLRARRHTIHCAYGEVRLLPGKHIWACCNNAVIKGCRRFLHGGIVFRFVGIVFANIFEDCDGRVGFIAFAQHALAAEPCVSCKVQKHGRKGDQEREQHRFPAHAQTAFAAVLPYHGEAPP